MGQPPHVRHEEVVNGAVPPAHARSNGLLLLILGQRGTLLPQLGMHGRWHQVGKPGLAGKGSRLSHAAQGAAKPVVHHLAFGSAHVRTVTGQSLSNQVAVDVVAAGLDDRHDIGLGRGCSLQGGQGDLSSNSQILVQVVGLAGAAAFDFRDHGRAGRSVALSDDQGRQVGHRGSDGGEPEGASRVFLEFDAAEGGFRNSAL